MIIIITGASSGIGYEVAKYLAKKAHTVYGIARRPFTLDGVHSIEADVTNLDRMKQVYQEIFTKEKRIDVLINNAGMGISGSIEETNPNDAAALFNVNFMGTFYSVKASLPYLRESQGKIINIGSVAGSISIPFQSFYSASKAAIAAFSDALANEVKPFKISVCTILPGDIKSDFTSNRKKNMESALYEKRVNRSVAVMERDEQNGMHPKVMAKVISRLINKKRMPLRKTIGFKYKLFIFLDKFLPKKLVNYAVGKLYGFHKEK